MKNTYATIPMEEYIRLVEKEKIFDEAVNKRASLIRIDANETMIRGYKTYFRVVTDEEVKSLFNAKIENLEKSLDYWIRKANKLEEDKKWWQFFKH
jgi:hypothetical protein